MPDDSAKQDSRLVRQLQLLGKYNGELDESKREALRSGESYTDDEWEAALDLWSEDETDAE